MSSWKHKPDPPSGGRAVLYSHKSDKTILCADAVARGPCVILGHHAPAQSRTRACDNVPPHRAVRIPRQVANRIPARLPRPRGFRYERGAASVHRRVHVNQPPIGTSSVNKKTWRARRSSRLDFLLLVPRGKVARGRRLA